MPSYCCNLVLSLPVLGVRFVFGMCFFLWQHRWGGFGAGWHTCHPLVSPAGFRLEFNHASSPRGMMAEAMTLLMLFPPTARSFFSFFRMPSYCRNLVLSLLASGTHFFFIFDTRFFSGTRRQGALGQAGTLAALVSLAGLRFEFDCTPLPEELGHRP